MARRTRPVDRLPKELRPMVGGAVLVAAVRGVDALWHRVTGRPTPVEARAAQADPRAAASGDADAARPATVRDRLVYALLLGAAMRVAGRLGLPRRGTRDGAPDDTRGDTRGGQD